MNKELKILIGMILLFGIICNVTAEMYLWNDVIIDANASEVTHHLFYFFEDTSARGIGKNKDVPVVLWYNIEPLPYNLSLYGYGGLIDKCELTIKSYHNIYGTTFMGLAGFYGGELLNTTTETINMTFENTGVVVSDAVTINMRDRDNIVADLICHYTDPNYLFIDNALFGRLTTYLSTYECDGCGEKTFEQISNELVQKEQVTANELEIYDKIQTVIDWNFQIWVIASWIFKIVLVVLAIVLIFAVGYYFYKFLENLSKDI